MATRSRTLKAVTVDAEPFDQAAIPNHPAAFDIPLDRIRPNPNNPRRDARADNTLIASVATVGILQPLVVRPNDNGFQLLAGHRRLDAARKAGLPTVPAIVRATDDAGALEIMIVENLARQDLTPLEEATGIGELAKLGRTQRQIADLLGTSQPHISKRLGLLKLPDRARTALDHGEITVEEGTALAALDTTTVDKLWKNGPPRAFDIAQAVRHHVWEKARAKKIAELTKAGVTVVEERPGWNRKHPPCRVVYLDLGTDFDHTIEPCHAVHVTHTGDTEDCCTDPSRHPDPEDDRDDDEEPAGESPMRLGPTGTEALGDDTTVDQAAEERKAQDAQRNGDRQRRREFFRTLLDKPRPLEVIALAAWVLPVMSEIVLDGVWDLLAPDVDEPAWDEMPASVQERAGDQIGTQSQVVYAIVLDAADGWTFAAYTRHDHDLASVVRRFLLHLEAAGYELSDPERQLLDPDHEEAGA
jgi:ParB/RepB/Spo0J family partition protein